MNEYEGHWIETFTGLKFHYLNPQPSEICIEDIAHALSLTSRFGGHCEFFYSVAQHSVLVSDNVPDEYKLVALLHDSEEAYIGDLPRPIKRDLGWGFIEIERTIRDAIFDKFGIKSRETAYPIVKRADNLLLSTEARDLMKNKDGWAELPEPLRETIGCWTPKEAEGVFLSRFRMMR